MEAFAEGGGWVVGGELPGFLREGVAVDEKAGVFGNLVVEAAGGSVGFVGEPVDAESACGAGGFMAAEQRPKNKADPSLSSG